MSTRARIRGRHEKYRAAYRDRNHPETGWQEGTVVYQGERLIVLALDDGTTRHVYDWEHELSGLGTGQQGDRVADTDDHGNVMTGWLDVCHTCAGHGKLFIPDPQQPEITEQPPDVQDLTTEAYRLLELIETRRARGGVYLVGDNSAPWITAYANSDHGSWFAVDKGQFHIASMGSLEAAGLITITSARTDDDYDALPGLLFKAMHREGTGRTESDWQGLGVYRPEPTSDPHAKPERAAMEQVLRVALDWLYKTEQPPGAGITQHGIGSGDLPTIPTRRIGLLPGHGDGPIISVRVAAPVKVDTLHVRNPLAPDELAEWAEVIRDLGYDVVEDWTTNTGGESGSIKLAESQHPSLSAAYQLYLTGCTTHTYDETNRNGEHGGSLCRCGWWRTPTSLLVHPTWPTPTAP